MVATQETAPAKVTFRDVFAVGEYRALWAAQLVSVAGDQFARIALAVLVYQRTRSPLLAALVFAATVGAQFAGGLLLGWTADRWPRRTVMLVSDVSCCAVVAAMLIPGIPLGAVIGLLFASGLAFQPFLAARMAINQPVLGPEKSQLGRSVTLTTYQVAQLAGAAAGGVTAAAVGVRPALAIDAASFAVSAAIIAAWVKVRPAPEPEDGQLPAGPSRPQFAAGIRAVFAVPAAWTGICLMWLAAFFAAPEGVTAPLAAQYGQGEAAVGWLLAAMTAGAVAGNLAWGRLLPSSAQGRLAAVAAAAACGVLVVFAAPLPLAAVLAVLAGSALFTGYIATAADAVMGAVPDARRGQASGLIGAGMSLGQGLAIVAAGAAAQRFTPTLVVAGCGAAGVLCAVPLAVRWRKVRPAA